MTIATAAALAPTALIFLPDVLALALKTVPRVSRKKVGGITFFRLDVAGRRFNLSFSESKVR